MKYSDGERTVRKKDPVLVQPSDHTGIFVGKIVGFSEGEKCCHVLFNDIIYKGIYSKEVTYWK